MSDNHQCNIFVFDIETIPQERLTPLLWQELERKVETEAARTSKDREKVRLELQSLKPAFGRILCIGALYKNMNSKGEWKESCEVFYSEDERQTLSNFWKRLADFEKRRTVFVSFNGLRFDVPFIITRTVALDLPPTNQSFLDTYRYGRFPHFDMCSALENQLTLEAACEIFGVNNPKAEEIRGSRVFELYKEGKILEILSYCLRDVIATYEVFQKIRPFYPTSYQDERKMEKIGNLKGELMQIPSRSPRFKCIACSKTLYPESLDFSLACNEFVCAKCKVALENDSEDKIYGYHSYRDVPVQKYTWEELLNYKASQEGEHRTDDFVPFEEEIVDDIPFEDAPKEQARSNLINTNQGLRCSLPIAQRRSLSLNDMRQQRRSQVSKSS